MGFLFPLFLLAGLSVLIPMVIHLVNLRKYKKEFFPNVRFLKRFEIISKKSSELRRRWLLLTRILFIIALVFAFAHPFLKKEQQSGMIASGVSVLYIDNSYSMSAQQDGQPLLALAKNSALQLLQASPNEMRFIILSNDRLYLSSPVDKAEACQEVDKIELSRRAASLDDIKNILLVGATPLNLKNKTPVYLFSDFQAATLNAGSPVRDSISQFTFYLFPIQSKKKENVFIDSVSLQHTFKRGASPYNLIVKLGRQNDENELSRNLRLAVDGQMRLVQTVTFPKGRTTFMDTLPAALDKNGWIKAELTVADEPVSFDDTFRLSAKVPSGFSVLVLSKGGRMSPFLQAAFQSMPGINVKVMNSNFHEKVHLETYSLVIVQNGEESNAATTSLMKEALDKGLNVLIFPGVAQQQTALNNCLHKLADIRFGSLNTTNAQVVSLQKNHPLLSGIFESIPEQMQLPVANRHFPLTAGLSANEQDIMSFQDGTPLLTEFDFDLGKLYICSAPLINESSNFPLSYFFAPLLYKMAVPTGATQQFFTSIGSVSAVHILNNQGDADNQAWHLFRKGEDLVPPQKVEGRGIAVYVGKVAEQTGFYWLKQGGDIQDSIWVAVNNNPLESRLQSAPREKIESALAPQKVVWLNRQKVEHEGWQSRSEASFPLWKIAVLVALFSLIAETILLLNPSATKKYR